MTKGERIKQLRKRTGKNQVTFADLIGVSKQTLYKYENDIITNIPSDKIELIAKETGSTPGYIMGWEDITGLPNYPNILPIVDTTIPVLGQISCGEPIYMDADRRYYVQEGADVKADFILIASGDSMINARIHDGDLVFIRKQSVVDNGDIAAVAIGDEALLKRFYLYKDLIVLRAENPQYPDIEIAGADMANVHILGKAIAFQSDVR